MQRSNHQLIQSPEPGQNDLKFRSRARRTIKIEPAAQTVRHDVVEDMQAKACTAEMAARRVEWPAPDLPSDSRRTDGAG